MNVIVGLGNTGTQIVKECAKSKLLTDESFFTIDSVCSMDMADPKIVQIPIISDDKSGSGRNRERGKAMFEYHYSLSKFDEMFLKCAESKLPVIVISSAAGGTGSGSITSFCGELIKNGIDVIPIIIIPADSDPTSYHMNTAELFFDLKSIEFNGSYCIFRNPSTSDYSAINKSIVKTIEVLLGKYYNFTTSDSIDDSDLTTILSVPGRIVASVSEGTDIHTVKKELTRAVLSGYQPAWSTDDAEHTTSYVAESLTSKFASKDFDEVFEDLNTSIGDTWERYKNISDIDESETCIATIIIAGLPTVKAKNVTGNFNSAGDIAEGMNLANVKKPAFMTRKKASVDKDSNGNMTFKWR